MPDDEELSQALAERCHAGYRFCNDEVPLEGPEILRHLRQGSLVAVVRPGGERQTFPCDVVIRVLLRKMPWSNVRKVPAP